MYAKRIIPCLDVKNGRVVKGVSFVDLVDAGDPVACAAAYDAQGADELVLLDITATHEGRGTMTEIVRRVAETVFIPFTVGGGIASVEDFTRLLRAGADLNGGRIPTGLDAVAWAKEAERRGAGEILLTSMDCDGQKTGYDLELTRAVSQAVGVPVIASGGAGKAEHFLDAFTDGKADAVLAASLFHFNELPIPELKAYLNAKGVPVRL